MDAHLPQELHIVELHQPIGIVDHQSPPLGKVNETGHLLLEAVNMMGDDLRGQHAAHIRFAGGIADHTGAAAHQGDGAVPRSLHMRHHHHLHKMPHMQAVRCGIKADVKSDRPLPQQFPYSLFIGGLSDDAPVLQFIKYVFHLLPPNKKAPCLTAEGEMTRGTTSIYRQSRPPASNNAFGL